MNLTNPCDKLFLKRFLPMIRLKCTSAGHMLLYPFRLLFTSAAIVIASSSDAWAYIDPGYGSLLWQLLIASVFGILFYARSIIFRIKTWFNIIRKRQPKAD